MILEFSANGNVAWNYCELLNPSYMYKELNWNVTYSRVS